MDERFVSCAGHRVRVWEKGTGEPLIFLAGFMGLPRWIRFLDLLAETRRVVVPSLPGFPGAAEHRHLDDLGDWTAATLEILEAAVDGPVDLVASSVAGALALEAAAMHRPLVRRLVLIAPFGVYVDDEPATDPWAQRPGPDSYPTLLCAKPDRFQALWELPSSADEVSADEGSMNEIEWQILGVRAREASARYLWPLGDTGIMKRAYRLTQPMLLVRGSQDALIPRGCLEKLRDAAAGEVLLQEIAGAGHLVELDEPDALAAAIRQFLS